MNRRDEQLGRALNELDVPDHAPDFFDRLEAQMAAHDRTARMSTAPRSKRSGRRARSFRPLAFAGTGLAAAAVLLVALSLTSPDTPLPSQIASIVTPQVATAAEVSAKVAEAVRTMRSVAGTAVLVTKQSADGPGIEQRFSFSATARGDFAMLGENRMPDGETITEQVAYDAETGTERVIMRSPSFSSAEVRTGLAPAAPDATAGEWVVARRLAALVNSLERAGDGSVREETLDGRDVWVLETGIEPDRIGGEMAADHLSVTVDRETGFPLQVIETRDGAVVSELRFEDVRFDEPLADDAFSFELPAEPDVSPIDFGFSRVELHEAGDVAAYAPLAPTWLPDGFELAEVAVARRAQSTGKEGANPESRGVISIVYRRGFELVAVSTRLAGENHGAWSDPLASPEGAIDRPQAVRLSGGAFDGASAELVIGPRAVPHLWAVGDRLVVTVSGDLTAEQLVRVAESLRPASD